VTGSGSSGTDLVIFGASGDLTRRKILPALGALDREHRLRVVGAGRSDLAEADFSREIAEASGDQDLGRSARWVRLDYSSPGSYTALKAAVGGDGRTLVFYLATPPSTFSSILDGLAESGVARRGDPRHRIVVEKPLGMDVASARELNGRLGSLFEESQVYRIDHYLAKDTV